MIHAAQAPDDVLCSPRSSATDKGGPGAKASKVSLAAELWPVDEQLQRDTARRNQVAAANSYLQDGPHAAVTLRRLGLRGFRYDDLIGLLQGQPALADRAGP